MGKHSTGEANQPELTEKSREDPIAVEARVQCRQNCLMCDKKVDALERGFEPLTFCLGNRHSIH